MPDQSETSQPAAQWQVGVRFRRSGRTLAAVIMRLVLLGPLRILKGLLWCVEAAAERLADGVRDAERAIAPICELPFHAYVLDQLNQAKEEDRKTMLEVLERATR